MGNVCFGKSIGLNTKWLKKPTINFQKKSFKVFSGCKTHWVKTLYTDLPLTLLLKDSANRNRDSTVSSAQRVWLSREEVTLSLV